MDVRMTVAARTQRWGSTAVIGGILSTTRAQERNAVASDHIHPFDPDAVERARAARLTVEQAERLSAVLGLISDPVRARVICALLAVDELCVGDAALAADVNDDAASYALRLLRTAGLVQRRRQGRLHFYRLADDDTQPALRSALTELLKLSEQGPFTR